MVCITWCYPGHSREKSASVGVRERVGADSRGRDGEVKASLGLEGMVRPWRNVNKAVDMRMWLSGGRR